MVTNTIDKNAKIGFCKHRTGKCVVYCDLYDMQVPIVFCSECKREKEINIVCSSSGIGDVITGLYPIAGIKKKFPDFKITYYSHHPMNWARLGAGIEHRRIFNNMPVNVIDMFYRYDDQLNTYANRKDWYASRLNVDPEVPEVNEYWKKDRIYTRNDYILLSPNASWATRDWPKGYWYNLEDLIQTRLGLDTVIIDGPGQEERCRAHVSSTYFCGCSTEEVCNLMMNAKAVICNDSGMAHVAGLIGANTIVIMAHMSPDSIFSLTRVKAVVPDLPCRFCFFRYQRGYRIGCDSLCAGLAGISPFHVLNCIERVI